MVSYPKQFSLLTTPAAPRLSVALQCLFGAASPPSKGGEKASIVVRIFDPNPILTKLNLDREEHAAGLRQFQRQELNANVPAVGTI